MALTEHAGAVGGSQYQFETVGDFFQAVFNCDAGHDDLRVSNKALGAAWFSSNVQGFEDVSAGTPLG
jgi:hypothetical protein